MTNVRRISALATALLLAATLVGPALAKEGAVASFRGPFPAGAAPGTTVTLTWDLAVPDAAGDLRPWGGTPVGVRLVGSSGAATEAMGIETAVTGRYAADVVVPAGAIAAVEAFVRGAANGVRSDLPIAVSPDPLAAASPVPALAPASPASPLLLAALAAAVVALLAVVRRRRAVGAAAPG